MPSADTSWFTIEIYGKESSEMEAFSVYGFKGHEEVSSPYIFTLDLVHRSAKLKLSDFIGEPALLQIQDKSGITRPVHGFIKSMAQTETMGDYTFYRAVLVPRFAFLKETSDHRIFQDLNVLEIIELILTKKHGFDGESFEFRCFQIEKNFPKREYCVQYGESDFHFISRLCEEEGLLYFFEHEESRERIVFSNLAGGEPVVPRDSMRFFKGSGQVAEETVLSEISLHEEAGTDHFEFREWNFEKPAAGSLPVDYETFIFEKSHPPRGLFLEKYRYPHLYQEESEGNRYAYLEGLRKLTFSQWIEGKSDAVHFVPGFTFEIHSHPNPLVNTEIYDPEAYFPSDTATGPRWWLFRVEQEGEQPQVLQELAPDRGFSYRSSFVAIPSRTRFIPEERHKKNRVIGNQTAIVTGPENEEIYTDLHGRTKVQFMWDRFGAFDEKTSCWVRVAQGWAGSTYGSMAIPRIGQEVVVSFLEGDPDRPLITGRVYNARNKPPYLLPEHKTRTVFKSMSTPGESAANRGFNELRIEDLAGSEEIYLHAEKDVNTFTKNDWKDHILRDLHETVEGNTYAHTLSETHEVFEKDRKTEILTRDNLTVHGDSHFKAGGKWLAKSGTEIHLYAGVKAVIEAGTEMTIKAGGSSIKIDPAGVHLNGARINLGGGGSPSAGTKAAPALPEKSIKPEEAARPVFAKPDFASHDQASSMLSSDSQNSKIQPASSSVACTLKNRTALAKEGSE